MSVDGVCRIRVVPSQHLLDDRVEGHQVVGSERRLRKHGGEACGAEELVGLSQRELECLGQPRHHLAARSGPSGLEERNMAGGRGREVRECELGGSAREAPAPQSRPEWRDRDSRRAHVHHPRGPGEVMPFPVGESTRLPARQTLTGMRISTSTTIERPAADVWDLLGRRFGEASTWASSISASRAIGEPTIAGAPCDERECRVPYPAQIGWSKSWWRRWTPIESRTVPRPPFLQLG